MRKFLVGIAVAFLFVLSAKAQEADILEGCAPLTVNFTAPSGGSTHFWDFKDGGTATQANPGRIFTTPGTYLVEYSASNGSAVIGDPIEIKVLETPVLGFTVETTTGCTPKTLTLTNTTIVSDDITTRDYLWVFDNGTTSSTASPSFTFSGVGTQNISMQITTEFTSCNTAKIFTDALELFSRPDALFTTTPSQTTVCEGPLSVTFANTSTDNSNGAAGFSYDWDFGDGTSSTEETPATKEYAEDGTYTVTLTTSYDDGCSDSFSKSISIGSPDPIIESVDTVCADTIIEFSTPTSGNRQWDFGSDVCASSTSSSFVRAIFSTGGVKDISLTVTASSGLCSGDTTKQIFVDDSEGCLARPYPYIESEDTICSSDTLIFSTDALGSYQWNFNNDTLSFNSNSNLRQDSIQWAFGGTYPVELTLTPLGTSCQLTTLKLVYVDAVEAEIEADPTYNCDNPSVVNYTMNPNQEGLDFEWRFFPGSTRDTLNENPSVTYFSELDPIEYATNEFEVLIATVDLENPETGCTATWFRNDTLWLPNAKFTVSPAKGCAPLNVVFSDSSKVDKPDQNEIVQWEWVFGNGDSQITTTGQTSYTYNDPGEFDAFLIVTNNLGCVDTSFIRGIEVGEDISADLDFSLSSTEICLGDDVTLTASGDFSNVDGLHFIGEGDRIFHCDTETQVTVPYDQEAGIEDISLDIDYNGCISTIAKPGALTVNGAIAAIDFAASCDSSLVYTFSSVGEGVNKSTWEISDGTDTLASTFVHTFAFGGDFDVTLVVEDSTSGCPADTVTYTVNARDVEAVIGFDTIRPLCIGLDYEFTGINSVDVGDDCYQGYTWDFPGFEDRRPRTSEDPEATFSFDSAGTHTVMLAVKDINGCRDTAFARFKVYDMAVDAFFSDDEICIPALVAFNDSTVADTGLASWEWTFLDTTITEQNFSYEFTEAPSGSSYACNLTVTDSLGCTESRTFFIQYYTPRATISPASPRICVEDSISFFPNVITMRADSFNYSWDFGNGETTLEDGATTPYDTSGTYKVVLNYVEVPTGCSGSDSITFEVQDYPIAGFSFESRQGDQDTLCIPAIVEFRDTSDIGTLSSWDFGNGKLSTDKTPTTSYSRGTYFVELISSTSNGCKDTVNQNFVVLNPQAEFTFSPDSICLGEEVTFEASVFFDVDSWVFDLGNGDLVFEELVTKKTFYEHPENGSMSISFSFSATNDQCEVVQTKQLYIQEVIADFQRVDGIDSSWCFNSGPYPLLNTSQNADNFLWTFEGGETSTEQFITEYSFPSPGTYDISLAVSSDELGCQDTVIKQALIIENPVFNALSDTVCAGASSTLEIENPSVFIAYSWTPADDLDTTLGSTVVSSAEFTQEYIITATDSFNCAGFDTAYAVVIQEPPFEDWDTIIVIGDYAKLPLYDSDLYNFDWDPTDSLSCTQCDFPLARPADDIEYAVAITDVLGCFTSNIVLDVDVQPETFIRMPTSFTPNDDGTNDIVHVRGWGIKELLQFEIYNRWGELVYESIDLEEGWDGTKDGTSQESDIYVYKIKVLTWRDEELFTEGHLNLIK